MENLVRHHINGKLILPALENVEDTVKTLSQVCLGSIVGLLLLASSSPTLAESEGITPQYTELREDSLGSQKHLIFKTLRLPTPQDSSLDVPKTILFVQTKISVKVLSII